MKKTTRPAALSLWTFDAIRADGSEHHTRGRETQIFEKNANGQWRLVHIHYSAIR